MTTNSTNTTLPKFGVSSQVIAYSQFSFLVFSTILVIPLIIWRRNVQPLKARNPLLVFGIYLIYALLVAINSLFVGIGPEKYPCQLHLLVYAYGPLTVAANTIKSTRLLLELILANVRSSEVEDTPEAQAKRARIIYVLRTVTSNYFGLLVFGVLFIFHTGIYVINIVFVPTIGSQCDISSFSWAAYWTLIQLVVPIPIYLLILAISSIVMLIKRLNDTWSIRLELLLMPLYHTPLVVTFGVTWWFNDFWPEYYFSCTFFLWASANLDILINTYVPIFKTFLVRKRNEDSLLMEQQADQTKIAQEMKSCSNYIPSLHTLLKGDAFRKAFLRFTTASLCPESLLFWIDAKLMFEPCDDESRAISWAKMICEKYIGSNAIMELNLDGKTRNVHVKQIMGTLENVEKEGSTLPRELFHELIKHVEVDLMDSFSRFKQTREYKKLIKEALGV